MLGLTGVGGLAGCSGNGDGTATPGDQGTPTENPTPTSVEGFGEETDTPTQTPGDETSTPEPLPEVGGTYTDVISGDITTLNAVYNSENTAGGLISLAVHGAYGFRPGQQLFPMLFDLTSDDNQVWVASLRENMEWSDPYGEVTAEDFVYLVQEVHQSDWAGTPASQDWTDDINVTANGDYEWQIELPGPDPLFPKKPVTWGMRVVPKELIQEYVENQDATGFQEDEELLDLSYTGNLGPYKLENWERQSNLTYTRNENYFMRELAQDEDSDVPRAWANAPYFDELVTQIITEPSARVGALESGEVDEVGLEPSQAVSLEGTDGLYLNIAPQPYNTPVFYNMRANGWEMFRRKGVRQALGCAVDKPTYVEGVQRGYASPEYTWQPPWSPWYSSEVQNGVEKYGQGDLYGPEVTRSKMSEALSDTDYGYDGDTLLDPQGEQVELKLMYQAGQAVEESTAQFFKQEVENNAGIQININAVQAGRFDSDYFRQQAPENPDELEYSSGPYNYGPRDQVTSKEPWDLGMIYGLNTYPMTPGSADVFFRQTGGFNAFGYHPTWDAEATFNAMEEATTTEEYQEAVNTFLIELSKDQPMAMLSLGSSITGYRNSVQGPEEEFFNGWDFPTWYKNSE